MNASVYLQPVLSFFRGSFTTKCIKKHVVTTPSTIWKHVEEEHLFLWEKSNWNSLAINIGCLVGGWVRIEALAAIQEHLKI